MDEAIGRRSSALFPLAAPVLLLAWALLVLFAFAGPVRVPLHRAFSVWGTQGVAFSSAGFLGAAAGHGRAVVAAALVAGAAGAAGFAAASLVRASGSWWIAAFPLGMVLAGAMGLGLGLAGLFRPGPLAVLLGCGAAFAAFRAAAAAARLRAALAATTGAERWAAFLAAAVCAAVLPVALAPEVTYDALACHLGAPEEYLKAGRIIRLDRMMYSDFPLSLSMVYAFALVSGGDSAAKLIHAFLGIAAVAAAGLVARDLRRDDPAERRSRGAWAAALFAATPFLAALMGRANADLGVIHLSTAGVWWLARANSGSGFLVAGILLGGAAAIKVSGALAVAAGACVCLLRLPAAGFAPLAALCAGAAVAIGPWLARSWLSTGNPVYPFAFAVFGGQGWSFRNAAVLRQDLDGATYGNIGYGAPGAKLAAPWLMVMKDRADGQPLGPLPLVLFPAFLVWPALRAGVRVGRVGAFVAAFWLLWCASSRDPRFFAPAWPAACALSGLAAVSLAGNAGRAVRAVLLAFMAFAPLHAAATAWRDFNPGPVLWGAVGRERYMERVIPPADRYVPLAREAGKLVPPGRRILVVGGVKGSLMGARVLYQAMPDTPHLMAWAAESPSASRLGVRFRQENVGAVFYDAGGIGFFRRQFGHYDPSPREEAVLRGFWTRSLRPVRWITAPPARVLYLVVPAGTAPASPPMPGWPGSRGGGAPE